MKQNRLPDVLGLRLTRQALRVLKERGIFAHSPVSLEHQHLAKRYVVRGLESGGAAGDVGRYVTFTQADGQPVEYLHPVEAIGVNGLHAVMVAPVLVRVEMLRKGRTYELLITQHRPGVDQRWQATSPGDEESCFGAFTVAWIWICPERTRTKLARFCRRSIRAPGRKSAIPKRFRQAVRAITGAVNCDGCSHCHYVRPPQKEEQCAPSESVTA